MQFRPGEVSRPDMSRSGSFLAKGSRAPDDRSSSLGCRDFRYGACAFSTLEGYAGRNPETELAFLIDEETHGHRPGSRLTKRFTDAKQQQIARFCVQFALSGACASG